MQSFYQAFHIYQGEDAPQYTVNLAVADINREDPNSWVLATPAAPDGYTIEGDDMARLKKVLGI